MSERSEFSRAEDSLDPVDRIMVAEEVIDQILSDPRLDFEQREHLIREIEARIDDLNDDALAALVRNRGPRPRNQSGAEAQPERPYFE